MGGVDTVVLRRNLVYDVRSTSAFFMNNWSGGVTIHNLLLENNIFYTPECGVVMYVFYIDGLKMYNNTLWKSDWLGLAVGPSASRIEAVNNIFQNVDYNFLGGTYNASDHKYDYNLLGTTGRGLPLQAHDVSSADPKFRKIPIATDNTSAHVYRDVTAADFELMVGSPAIGKGTSGGMMPTVDFYGNPRVAPYDMGAIETQGSGIAAGPRPVSPVSEILQNPVQPDKLRRLAEGRRIYDLGGRRLEPAGLPGSGVYLLRENNSSRIRKIAVMP
jgi:hypothetical protein